MRILQFATVFIYAAGPLAPCLGACLPRTASPSCHEAAPAPSAGDDVVRVPARDCCAFLNDTALVSGGAGFQPALAWAPLPDAAHAQSAKPHVLVASTESPPRILRI
jgi:hypothetical protein